MVSMVGYVVIGSKHSPIDFAHLLSVAAWVGGGTLLAWRSLSADPSLCSVPRALISGS